MILYNKVQTSTHSSQALAPHKHWLQWPKTNDLGRFSMTKNRWQGSQWPKNRWPWRVLDDCSFPIHRTETRLSSEQKQAYSNDWKLLKSGWRAGGDVAPTWWNCNWWMALLEPQWEHCNTTNPKQEWQYLDEFTSDVDGSCIKMTVSMRITSSSRRRKTVSQLFLG